MQRRVVGAILVLAAAILYCTRYLAAALLGSSLTTLNNAIFEMQLLFVGNHLTTLSILSLIVGIGYLIWAEIEHIVSKKNKPYSDQSR